MYLFAIITTFIGVSFAQEPQDAQDHNILNVITVPPNCPPGQELVNGQCRDIWNWRSDENAAALGVIIPSVSSDHRNVITVPSNCPPGQQLINGVCRDVWRYYFGPTTPLPKQFPYSDEDHRDRRQTEEEVDVVDMLEIPDPSINRNIISIPNQCPVGYKPDAFGFCRRILD